MRTKRIAALFFVSFFVASLLATATVAGGKPPSAPLTISYCTDSDGDCDSTKLTSNDGIYESASTTNGVEAWINYNMTADRVAPDANITRVTLLVNWWRTSGVNSNCHIELYDGSSWSTIWSSSSCSNLTTADGTTYEFDVTAKLNTPAKVNNAWTKVSGTQTSRKTAKINADYIYISPTVATNYILNITNPTGSSPFNVTGGQDITVYFKFKRDSDYLTSNINTTSTTIGGQACSITTGGAGTSVSNAVTVAYLPQSLGAPGAVLASDGTAYIFGGNNVSGSTTGSDRILRYNTSNPTADAADTGARLTTPTFYITESAVINPSNGYAYILGGEKSDGTSLRVIQRYDTNNPASNAVNIANLSYATEAMGVVLNSSGWALTYGRYNDTFTGPGHTFYDQILKYNLNADTTDAVETGAVTPVPEDGMWCAITSADKSYCGGGTTNGSAPYTREILEHNTATPSVNPTAVSYMQIGYNVSHASAVLGPNGKIYLIGGIVQSGATNRPTTAIQEWDPSSPNQSAVVVAYLETAVYGAPAVATSDGYVYVFGGWTTIGGAMTNKIQRFRIGSDTNTACNAGTGVCQFNCTTPSGLSGLQDLYVQAKTLAYGETRSDTEANAINYG